MNKAVRSAAISMITVGLAGIVQAQQQMTISPAKGQSSQQMEKDKADCMTIAQQSVAQQPTPATQGAKGGRARGAARGAVAGAAQAEKQTNQYDRAPDAVQDEYRQQQAKQGAKTGAKVGAAAQRRSTKQQAQQQQASQSAAVDSAFRSCMTGRGYTVAVTAGWYTLPRLYAPRRGMSIRNRRAILRSAQYAERDAVV